MGKENKPSDKLADRGALTKLLERVFGDAQKKIIKNYLRVVAEINSLEPKYEKMTKKELQGQTEVLKAKLQKKKGDLQAILPEAFATVREASRRVLEMRHFDVQLLGGMVLNDGNIAEMKTGEGKTLVATLPLYLNALAGKGAHLVTVNDYLVQRDGGWMGEVYNFLGLSVGVVIQDASFIYDPKYDNENHTDPRMKKLKPATRKEAYAADITYATNNELGFDYLRDNMVKDAKMLRQRELNFAIVDEADSILIDEARTPLIISAPAADNPAAYYEFAKIIKQIGDDDFELDEKRRSVTLTDSGVEKLQRALGLKELYSASNVRAIYHVDQALRAEKLFKRDKDYVVTNDGEVIIVDEHTGRLMHGRRYSEGLHQAIEAKEAVAVQQESMTLATISFQNFFRLYNKLSGMTGTAFTEAEEFQQIYGLGVVQIPSNKPLRRVDLDDLIYRTEDAKMRAIVAEVKKYHKEGRPVLIGSASIVKNELLAEQLAKAGLKFELLNAKNNEREAEIVARAGEKGAITLATNMAGRGTDIKLGEGVAEMGGLVVIGSERHESRRIDNQLRGRGGRQGDMGTTQFFVSTEDDLMRIFQGDRLGVLLSRLGVSDDQPIQAKMISKSLEGAQKRVEGFHFDSRKNVVQYDNVIARHRNKVYRMRRQILEGADLRKDIDKLMREAVDELVAVPARYNKKFADNFEAIFFGADLAEVERIGKIKKTTERQKAAREYVKRLYDEQEEKIGAELLRRVEREVYLSLLDTLWMQHLENMQHLREGIHWRSVGQRDPLVEYRSESQKLFEDLEKTLRETVVKLVLTAEMQDVPASENEYQSELTQMAAGQDKGVNEITSGKKIDSEDFDKTKKVARKSASAKSGKTGKSGKSGGKNKQKKSGGKRKGQSKGKKK
ncbi:MAG: preprotein translocase subunit SecA [Candidatus Nomurabacteria bacterium]|jgi:preprotein translocase subunit SecA|nr:preprotein translocase subunit SecA [Candidatus Nomurabacteria bacterium]